MDQPILPEPSSEQQLIIGRLASSNLIVDSVAGSGKTTLNLHLAAAYPDLEILLLTYNARLKAETRTKVTNLGIDNLEVHSYHSWAVRYLDSSCHTDRSLQNFLQLPLETHKIKTMPYYDLIIIDEAQDLTPLYYRLVAYIYFAQPHHVHSGTKFCVVGDKYQSIYGFQNADPRMITLANYLFNFNSNPVVEPKWSLANLSTSFRVSQEVAQFLNKCCLGYDRIHGHKSTGVKPRYLICDCFMGGATQTNIERKQRISTVYNEVLRYFALGYRPADFFILAPSIRSSASPVRQLANRLTLEGIDVYVPITDEERLDERVIAGKVVFSSFHQVKGLERPVVLVFNFDDSYFKYYKSDADPYQCPNEIYVALTRSTEHLSIFHHYSNNWMPFLKKRDLHQWSEIIESRKVKPSSNARQPVVSTSVTDLIRHLSLEVLTHIEDFFTTKQLRPPKQVINLPHVIQTGETPIGYEHVSEINGIAIPAYFEWLARSKMSIYRVESLLQGQKMATKDNQTQYDGGCLLDASGSSLSLQKQENMPDIPDELLVDESHPLTIPKLLKIATLWTSYTSGYLFKLRQIRNYNWLTRDQLRECKERVRSLKIGANAEFERKVELEERPELANRRLTGYIDLLTGNRVYELKCVEMVKTEHLLQLAIYMYLFLARKPESEHGSYEFYLYNILSDELIQITSTFQQLSEMVGLLIRSKYFAPFTLEDGDFVAKITDIRETMRGKFSHVENPVTV